ncbi:TPA: BMP family ABC transporter substrate-binding protein [Streptococcus pneumoniae]|nr:BMP family ABC transporter substrate-binding protein [Streptococcus pneumoniae]
MYYAENPDAAHDIHELRVDLLGQKMTFLTDAGVFSKKMVDFGSQLLLKCLYVNQGETVLDVGCGYGPLGLSLVKVYGVQATMVDINTRALDLARRNAEKNNAKATIFQSNIYEQVEGHFDHVISNPPIRAGKQVVHEIIEKSKDFLETGGDLTIVIQKKQGAPSAKSKNVASVTFADNESGYLAGVAAAKTTKTKQVGFVGGIESEVISRFEAGFKAGVASVDPSIKVQVDYAGSFGDAAKGKTIAAAQYAAGADIVYQVAGGTGAGVFAEAKSLNESRPENEKVWVIGVDRDQEAEGKYTSKDGKESNFVLVSTLKQVGTTVKDISNKAEKGEFPGGQVIVYSLKDKGVDLAVTNLSEEGKKAVEDAKAKILDGSVKVPEK